MSDLPEITAVGLREKLESAVSQIRLEMSPNQLDRLVEYLLELSKWNRTYNLTAVKGLDAMLSQHLLDCLAIVPAIQRYESKTGTHFRTIADVGSGPGLPAVILAVCSPEREIISIDAVEKKTTFVSHVSNRLGLVNLTAQHARVEHMEPGVADLVISRAFAALVQFVEKAAHLVNPDGVMAAMKSKQLEAERKSFEGLRTGWRIDQVDSVEVPQLHATRFLAWLKREVDHE